MTFRRLLCGMQHSREEDLEIAIIVKGRHRFDWEVQDQQGNVYAHGKAVSVAMARGEAELARRGVKSRIPK